jgi:hypothetical protein
MAAGHEDPVPVWFVAWRDEWVAAIGSVPQSPKLHAAQCARAPTTHSCSCTMPGGDSTAAWMPVLLLGCGAAAVRCGAGAA